MKKIILSAIVLTGLYAETFLDLEKRCYQGSMIDCYNLALMYESGGDRRRSVYRAARLHRMVCNAGEPKDLYLQSCYSLGFIYFLGKEAGIRQDFSQAMKLFSKACDKDEQKSCYQLGIMHLNGNGVTQSDTTAIKYFSKACKLGHSDACKDYEKLTKEEK